MNDQYAGFSEQLATGLRLLPDKPEETADSTLRALWHAAAGRPLSASAALRAQLPVLDDGGRQRLQALLDRRLAGTPLAHLTGRQAFLGLEMLAGPEALVPRRETELLGHTAISLARAISSAVGGDAGRLRVVDACTGCGNLALAIAHALPHADAVGVDISEDALALARRNAEHLGLQERTRFLAGDLLAPLENPEFHGRVDLLTCNPPYISSGKVAQMDAEIAGHEPVLAFDGGPLGVAILMRLLQDAPRFLRPGGWLAFEVGMGQGNSLARRVRASGHWQDVREVADDTGTTRVIAARA